MLIGVDASRAVSAAPTGTELYSRRLIEALLALEDPRSFRLYLRSAPDPGAFRGADLRLIPFPRLWTHARLSWEMARRPPDALFVPAHVLPLVRPRASVATVHDLGYLHFPEAHPWRQRTYLDISTRWNAVTAAHLLADSEATRDDLISHYGVTPGKITVAYPGRDETLAPVGDAALIDAAKARYGIDGDYFLFLGTLQPRKNLARLIAAYASLAADTLLVLAGKQGWFYSDLCSQVRRLGLEGRVLFPGYIDQADKAALLSGATAFVFPSLYEGFGLPVVEAQACGCPVITSVTSSLGEVAGDGALLVDPSDEDAIAAAMRRVVRDSDLRQALAERGEANSRRFSWEGCAKAALGVIRQVVV
ncbi:MAG: glycosyltransferase family 1 protein [Anaerolineales bacterium]|nr:MAG: glycosyltransferase family 1 protein [Anaerolineales bacterium]